MDSFPAIAVALMVAMVAAAEAQSDCVSNLLPCAQYLNSTSPPPSCCNAIRQVVTNQLPCLCQLYENRAALGGINITQALLLPRYCNVPGDVSLCKALAPASAHSPAPAVLGGNGNGGSNGVGRSISWTGMPILILISAVALFF